VILFNVLEENIAFINKFNLILAKIIFNIKCMNCQKKLFKIKNISLLIIFVLVNILIAVPVKDASAYLNMLKGGNFEDGLGINWDSWKIENSHRNYEINRSYSAALDGGSYSLSIRAVSGEPDLRWQANISGNIANNTFKIEAGKAYQVSFYAKSDKNTVLSLMLQDVATVNSISEVKDIPISAGDWQKQIVTFYPLADASKAILVVQYGDLAVGTSINLDSLQMIEFNASVLTTEIKGNIGEQKKLIKINNIIFYDLDEIEIELPYFNPITSEPATKRFHPLFMDSYGIYIDMFAGTYAGIGKVYANSQFLGSFNYNVLPKITEFYPGIIRVGEDLTVYGNGFNPEFASDKTYIVMKSMNNDGRITDVWIKPHTIDSLLSQMTLKIPVGIVSGNIYVQSAFRNNKNVDIINKSNALKYTVKPVISSIAWNKKGYEQVGDKITLKGRGISYSPYVKFYDKSDILIATVKANLLSLGAEEAIEVVTPKKLSNLSLTIVSGGEESDKADALSYTAKTLVTGIKTSHFRTNLSTNSNMQAAKIGEEITIYGKAFYSPYSETKIEFQGDGKRIIAVPVAVDPEGSYLKVAVPEGAQNGYIGVIVHDEISNYLPLEIIPTVVSISPANIVPGMPIIISANGMGKNINLSRVYFQITKNEQIIVIPETITMSGNIAHIAVTAPLALANNSSIVRLQYDKWTDDSGSSISVDPYITSAYIDTDTHILSIRGYGFSILPKENIITYKYADQAHTIITPKVVMLGVYPDEDGQEIRIKISDNYYYGFVNVTVGNKISNEANFGPVVIKKVAKRVQFVAVDNQQMGVLYISGYNFGAGDVMVGASAARVDYRSDFFIIAVVPSEKINDGPVIVTKK
jgi:hypothetical protein